MTRFKEKYQKEIIPELKKQFGNLNIFALPRVKKVVINVGTGVGLKDPKHNELVENTLERISGQKPVKTLAKKSISNFKIREGQVLGYQVTLRGARMYDFIDKLVNITLPRVRDFRGISTKIVDKEGNLNLGFKEHMAFPEIHSDEVEKIHGLQVTVVTSGTNREQAVELFKLFGFPFHKDNQK